MIITILHSIIWRVIYICNNYNNNNDDNSMYVYATTSFMPALHGNPQAENWWLPGKDGMKPVVVDNHSWHKIYIKTNIYIYIYIYIYINEWKTFTLETVCCYFRYHITIEAIMRMVPYFILCSLIFIVGLSVN